MPTLWRSSGAVWRLRKFSRPSAAVLAVVLLAVCTSAARAAGPRQAVPAPVVRTVVRGETVLSVLPVAGQSERVRVLVSFGADAGEHPAAADELTLRRISSGVGTSRSLPAMAARRTLRADSLELRPLVPLVRGGTYRAEFTRAGVSGQTADSGVLAVEYRVPSLPRAAAPRVVSLTPSGPVVPANHLKFYVTFSEPMQRPGIFRWFRLQDLTTGEDVPRPFRHTELWSADQRQLTLWFHPGRQKTGVNLNVEIGPILEEGRRYRLVISGDWPSEAGTPLGQDVTRVLRAGPADHAQPELARWVVDRPFAGGRDPLVLRFDEPLDAALLRSEVAVVDAAGRRVAGRVTIPKGEQQWRFRPQAAWQEGTYRLAVGRVLEDLAGNSLERPFEVDVSEVDRPEVPEVLYRAFVVLPGRRQPASR